MNQSRTRERLSTGILKAVAPGFMQASRELLRSADLSSRGLPGLRGLKAWLSRCVFTSVLSTLFAALHELMCDASRPRNNAPNFSCAPPTYADPPTAGASLPQVLSAAGQRGGMAGARTFKVAELKEQLSQRGLSSIGKKDELVARLLADEAAAAPEAEPAAPAEASTGPTEPIEAPAKRQKPDRVRLNVGGTVFETSMTTLTGGSSFFASMFSRWDDNSNHDPEGIFIDRDADAFRVLLSCMRQGAAVLPTLDRDLCARVLLDAQYLGVDGLLHSVKAVAWRHMNPLMLSACKDDDATCAIRFDQSCSSIDVALREGTLPARFFSSVAKPRRKPRSFSVKVRGTVLDSATDEASVNGPGLYWFGDRESEIPQAGEGECVYLHSAVLTGGYAMLQRLAPDEKEDLDELPGDFATQACYLDSGRTTFNGNFILQYKRADGEEATNIGAGPIFTLAKRGLDDAGAKTEDAHSIHDINFREVLDTVVDGNIYLRALGLGDWDVHGWVGALQDIPRAGVSLAT